MPMNQEIKTIKIILNKKENLKLVTKTKNLSLKETEQKIYLITKIFLVCLYVK